MAVSANEWKQREHGRRRNAPLPDDAYTTPGKGVCFTLRVHTGQPFAANDGLCNAVCGLLATMRTGYGCWVGAYCLMPDHLHFVAGPHAVGCSVLTFVERFKGRSTNESWKFGWTGRLWQPRFHDHVLRAAEDLPEIYTYVVHNPVRAGLVEQVEDWPWSGVLDGQE